MRRHAALLLSLTLMATCGTALAHVGGGAGAGVAHHQGLMTGFLHTITGLDHLAAMLAVGVWSAMTSRRVWTAPLAFALTLLAGALLAQAGVAFPAVEPVIAASMLVVGLLLAARIRLPDSMGGLLIGTFALFHGAAHGQELSGTVALVGMVAGTAVLHLVGLGLGLLLRQRSAWLPRLAGGLLALFGLNLGWSLMAG